MSVEQGIHQELTFGQVISRTFGLFRRGFVRYFSLFVIFEMIIGTITYLAEIAFVLPTLPASPTPQQTFAFLPAYLGAFIPLIASLVLASIIFGTIAEASAMKMTSDEIQSGVTDVVKSIRFSFSKILWIWALSIVLAVIVGFGFAALIVPGIILAIMFSLAIPALLFENSGVVGSMGRSRELVGHRWLKTFVIFVILGIIVFIASNIVNYAASFFGPLSPFISSFFSAFYQPVIPIALTIYYYSNMARMAQSQPGQMVGTPMATGQVGGKFCPSCGARIELSAEFCPKCGTKQPSPSPG